ncbi:hypothetical protein GGR55DRAFT_86820 [Xylaria sp. FL0064]|nr:hypothetical protein GGR55DRAFT_86820 [Xylaria sp. FL0064]
MNHTALYIILVSLLFSRSWCADSLMRTSPDHEDERESKGSDRDAYALHRETRPETLVMQRQEIYSSDSDDDDIFSSHWKQLFCL